MTHLSIRLLGCLEVALDGRAVTRFESDKVRALLAYLAAESAEPHRREQLVGLLWPDSPERAARTNLRHVLAQLRKVIGDREADPPFLQISRQTLQLNGAADTWVDVRAFADLLQCDVTRSANTAQLEEAVALYRGGFLEGFSLPDSPLFEEWALMTREQLRRLALEALERLVDCYEVAGEYAAALHHAWRQLELDPWRERAHRQLMRLLTLTGQRTAALAQYEACCRVLKEELGTQPAARTAALYEQILARELMAPATFSPVRNLPVQSTPFVGREGLLDEIQERLEDPTCRLLTLVGPGGCGKTRLALEAAERQLERYPHGVFFVSLAPLDRADAIIPTVADALSFTFYEDAEPRQQLLDYLRAKTMLLILDNFEHLLSPPEPSLRDGAALVAEILKTARGVKILATSRARLNVGGEHRFRVTGMRYPVPETENQALSKVAQYSAVRLFLQGARRAQQGFDLTDANMNGVVQICRLVQGMPLAIRLAAPWVTVLQPQDIASQLGRDLDLLATERRDVPARQRSVRASLDHTWRLISGRERELMQALSVFRGGFTREAAQQVTGASLHELMALVDRSLLYHSSGDRYKVHELLRQYANEQLNLSGGVAAAACERHCAYYAAAAEDWGSQMTGEEQIAAILEMQMDHENLRVAWEWAVSRSQVARLDQTLKGLCWFLLWRGRYREGRVICRRATDALGHQTRCAELRLRARLLLWEGIFCKALEQFHTAGEALKRCLGLLDKLNADARDIQAAALVEMASLALDAGDCDQARRMFNQSLDLYRSIGDQWGEARALNGIGCVAWCEDAFGEAQHLAQQSLRIRQALGDRRGEANSLHLLGRVAAYAGQMQESVRLRRKTVALFLELHDQSATAAGLFELATGLIWLGEFSEAQSLLQRSQEIYEDLGATIDVANINAFLGWIDALKGQYGLARAKIENSLLSLQDCGNRNATKVALLFLGLVALVEKEYVVAERSLKECAGIFEEVGESADWDIAMASLGFVARAQGRTTKAQMYLHRALETAVELHHEYGLIIMAIPLAALLLADAGQRTRAVEIYALAARYPYINGSHYYEDIAGRHIASVAATLPRDAVAVAQKRGRAQDLWETAQELARELEKQIGNTEGAERG